MVRKDDAKMLRTKMVTMVPMKCLLHVTAECWAQPLVLKLVTGHLLQLLCLAAANKRWILNGPKTITLATVLQQIQYGLNPKSHECKIKHTKTKFNVKSNRSYRCCAQTTNKKSVVAKRDK